MRNISFRLFYRFSVYNDGGVEPQFRGSALVPRDNSAAVTLVFAARDKKTNGVVTILGGADIVDDMLCCDVVSNIFLLFPSDKEEK